MSKKLAQIKDNTIQWESEWAEKYLLPEITEIAEQSARTFVRHFDRHPIDSITGEELVRPVRHGVDIRIEHENHRLYIVEWFTPTANGKITDEQDEILPGVYFREFYVPYHLAKKQAQLASQKQVPLQLELCYLPVIKIRDNKPSSLDWLEELWGRVRTVVNHADKAIKDDIKCLTMIHGETNDDGLYIGVVGCYNQETNDVEYVVQKHHALHFLHDENIEQNHIALKPYVHGVDATPWVHKKDPDLLNWHSAMNREVKEKLGKWVRVSRPSTECVIQLSEQLVEHMMGEVKTIFAKAEAALSEVPNIVTGSIRHLYNPMNSGIETHYKVIEQVTKEVDPANESSDNPETPVMETVVDETVIKQYDHGRDRAVILMIAGRIEPELWTATQSLFERTFNKTYLTVVHEPTQELTH